MTNVLMNSHYFQEWKQHAPLAPKTKKGYSVPLRKFGKYIEIRGICGSLNFDRFYHYVADDSYETIDRKFLDEFIAHLVAQGSGQSVLRQAICSVKSFMNYLYDVGLIRVDPYRYYPNSYAIDQPQTRDRALSRQDAVILLKMAAQQDPFTRTPYMIIWTMLVCGLRASEVCNLHRSQIKFENQTIMIDHGQKTRAMAVHIPKKLAQELERYVTHPAWPGLKTGTDATVFWIRNKPLSPTGLRKLLSSLARQAGLRRRVTPHDLRYTMACVMYELGYDISTIQRQMRHKHVTTTLHYLPVKTSLRAAVNRNSNKYKKPLQIPE